MVPDSFHDSWPPRTNRSALEMLLWIYSCDCMSEDFQTFASDSESVVLMNPNAPKHYFQKRQINMVLDFRFVLACKYIPFHGAMPTEWFPYQAMAPNIRRSSIFAWHPNWINSMCGRWPWFCAPWQTNPWAFWRPQPIRGVDGPVFAPTPCSNLRYVSSRPWPFHGDRPVPPGMDTMLRENLRKSFLRVF